MKKLILLILGMALLVSFAYADKDIDGNNIECDGFDVCDTFDTAGINTSIWTGVTSYSQTDGYMIMTPRSSASDTTYASHDFAGDTASGSSFEMEFVLSNKDIYTGFWGDGALGGDEFLMQWDSDQLLNLPNSQQCDFLESVYNKNVTLVVNINNSQNFMSKCYVNGVLKDTVVTTNSVTDTTYNIAFLPWVTGNGGTRNISYVLGWAGGFADKPDLNPPEEIPTATFGKPTPTDGAINNSLTPNININVTCTFDGNATLYWGTTESPSLLRSSTESNLTVTLNNSLITSANDTYYYIGNCGSGNVVNTSTRTFTFDNVTPIISINTGNFFDIDNISNQFQYDGIVKANISISDTRDLFGFLFNMTYKTNGTPYYTYTNTSLSGLTNWDYTKNINISTFPTGNYTIRLEAVDSHTQNKIPNYAYSYDQFELAFDTPEGNEIIIKSLRSTDWEIEKKTDRYSFKFIPYETDAKSKYKFQVYCDNGLQYLPNSNYEGHFVCMNWGKGGNWLDFEGTGNAIDVTDEGEGWYEIEVEFERSEITFNSIGGLNVRAINYTWYKGGYETRQSNNFTGSKANLTLNITQVSTIKYIQADLWINNTLYANATQTNYSGHTIFRQEVGLPIVDTSTDFTYIWNVTYIQTDDSVLTGNLSTTFLVKNWNLDDCTTNTDLVLNYTIRDEDNSSLQNLDVSLDYNYTLDGTTTRRFQKDLLSVNNFAICKSPADLDLTTTYTVSYSNDDYATRRYSETDLALNNNIYNRSLYTLLLSDGIFVRFNTVDQFNNIITGARGVMRLTINSTQQIVEAELTDDSGIATFFANPSKDYYFTFSKTSYPNTSFTLRPTTTDIITVVMGSGILSTSSSTAEGIEYSFKPTNTILNNQTNYTFQFNLTSDLWQVTNCTMAIKNASTTLTSASGTFTDSTCDVAITFNTGFQQALTAQALIGQNETNLVTYTQNYVVFDNYEGEFSLKNFFDDISAFSSAGFNDRTRLLISFIAIVVIMMIISQFVEIPNPEGQLILIWALVFFFSYVGWLTLAIAGLPLTNFPLMQQYGILVFYSMVTGTYLIWRYS